MSEEVKEPIADKDVKFGDTIGFNDLFVCKHRQGVYLVVGQPNKSGIIGIRQWSGAFDKSRKTYMEKASNLTNLGILRFYTTEKKTIELPKIVDGKLVEKKTKGKKKKDAEPELEMEEKEIDVVYNMTDVMNNLDDFQKDLSKDVSVQDYFKMSNTDDTLDFMEKVVPSYDPELFKPYHLRDLCKWYVWLRKEVHVLNTKNEEA